MIPSILAHLSMPVPRSWWEQALKIEHVASTRAALLTDLQTELSTAVDTAELLNPSLLVALAFIDDERAGNLSDCFGDIGSQYTPDEYLAKIKEMLAERPDLVQLGTLIGKSGGADGST